MARNSKLSKFRDFINREGFEWLMQPRRSYAHAKAQGKSLGQFTARYIASLLFLPLISAAYVVSRVTGVVLNPEAWNKNFFKPAMMGLLLSMLTTLVITSVGFTPLVALAAPYVGGFILAGFAVGSVLSVVAAGALYFAKTLGPHANSGKKREDSVFFAHEPGLSPKNNLFFSGEYQQKLKPTYQNLLTLHKNEKAKLEMPTEMNPGEYQEAVKQNEARKDMLYAFRGLIEADNSRNVSPQQLDAIAEYPYFKDSLDNIIDFSTISNSKLVYKPGA